jgi:hypothetical protein
MYAKKRMGRRIHKALLVSIAALSVSGCGTVGHHKTSDVYDLPFAVAADRTYAASEEEVRQAALFAMSETGLENIAEHQSNDGIWYATGEISYSWRSNGQFIRVAVRPVESGESPKTEALYSSLKRYEINVTEDLTIIEEKVLTFMDQFIDSM